MKRIRFELVASATFLALATSFSVASGRGSSIPVRLQLKWLNQAQFAGYYAAADLGYYSAQGLDVTLLPGAPAINSEHVVESGGAEFGVAWLPSLLAAHETGFNIVNVAQIFARSSTRIIVMASSGIKTVSDLKGKSIGMFTNGDEYEVEAALLAHGIDPLVPSDIKIVQPFTPDMLPKGQITAILATTYNEYAMLLETLNPATGKLYTPTDFVSFDMDSEGTAMLQDGIFADADWLAKDGNADVTRRFLAGSFLGWEYCRDHVDSCVQFVLKRDPQTLTITHQRWMLNEINKLIWPSTTGLGVMDRDSFNHTVLVAKTYEVISQAPEDSIFRDDLARAALALASQADPSFDPFGKSYVPQAVILSQGGR